LNQIHNGIKTSNSGYHDHMMSSINSRNDSDNMDFIQNRQRLLIGSPQTQNSNQNRPNQQQYQPNGSPNSPNYRREIDMEQIRYPSSPNWDVEYLLDFSKYTGDIVELENNSKISKYCINHPAKKSKQYVLESDQVKSISGESPFLRGLCNRCSINLIKNGITTIELEIDYGEREKILRTFLTKVHQTKNYVSNTFEEICSTKEIIEDHYIKQGKALELYEEKVDKIISI